MNENTTRIIDAECSLQKVLAEALGLPEYEYILKNVSKTDVSKDEKFQKKYNLKSRSNYTHV